MLPVSKDSPKSRSKPDTSDQDSVNSFESSRARRASAYSAGDQEKEEKIVAAFKDQVTTVDLVQQVTKSETIRADDKGVLRSVWFEISGTGMAPWEIHRPQQAVMELARRGAFARHSRVLDLGCGIGDNALYLARYCCCEVTAVDLVPRVLSFTSVKESLRGMRGRVTWVIADLVEPLQPPLSDMTFDVLLDASTFHALGDRDRPMYAYNCAQLCKQGGYLYLLGFSDKWPSHHVGGPRRLTRADVEDTFNRDLGWELVSLEDTYLEHHPCINSHMKSAGSKALTPQEFEYQWRGYAESYLAVLRRLDRDPVWPFDGEEEAP